MSFPALSCLVGAVTKGEWETALGYVRDLERQIRAKNMDPPKGNGTPARKKEPGERDSHIQMGVCYYVGKEVKREPLLLRYRESHIFVNLLEQALEQMPASAMEKKKARKGLDILRVGVTATAWAQIDEEEKGFRIDLSTVDTLGMKYAAQNQDQGQETKARS